MTPSDLDLMADVVEQATEWLKGAGVVQTDRAEFLVSRLLEYGIRGYTVARFVGLIDTNRRSLAKELADEDLPQAGDLMLLGRFLAVAAAVDLEGMPGTGACHRWELCPGSTSRSMERLCGIRFTGLQGRPWKSLIRLFLDRHLPGWAMRKVA